MNITDRIIQFIEFKGVTKYEFHKKNGFSNGFLDKSRAIGSDKCAIILENYPEISPEWLLTGKGNMLKNDSEKGVNIGYNSNIGGFIAVNSSVNEKNAPIQNENSHANILKTECQNLKTENQLLKTECQNLITQNEILKTQITEKDKQISFFMEIIRNKQYEK